jgi:hypothetical protein
MTKTIPEITDEMVELAGTIYAANLWDQKVGWNRAAMRAALTAAITEPEVEVTDAMVDVGTKTFYAPGITIPPAIREAMARAYRAMVKAAPKGAKSAPQGVNAGAPEKTTGGGVERILLGYHYRCGELRPGGKIHQHRRSTDPK